MGNIEQQSLPPTDYFGESKVERAVNFAKTQAKFGTDYTGRAFALLNEEGENPYAYLLHGKAFTEWLQYEAYMHGDILKQDDINEALSLLTAYARFEGDQLSVNLRSGYGSFGSVELDCADENGTRIQLKGGEVQILESGSELLFHHTSTTQALPIPAQQGDWKELLPFLNMVEPMALLLIGWLTYTIAHPKDPHVGYVMLCITGHHGAGKSLLCKSIIRRLVDPNASGIQVFPKDMKDVMISSQNMLVLIYDNLSTLSKDESNKLCVFATGGSFSTRKLYTDSDEHIMQVHAPIVLNGIEPFVSAPDLASRCLNIELQTLDAEKRVDEKILKTQLDEKIPTIYRGLLELAAKALHVVDDVNVLYPERMLGFVRWLAALELVMELDAGTLQKAYRDNLKQAMLETIQENPFAYAVLGVAKECTDEPWQGRPQMLLNLLNSRVTRHVRNNSRLWPQNPIALSKRLAVLQKPLAAQGVILQLGERSKHRQITLGFEVIESA